mgnify:CR=1 FL=1
MVSSDNLRWLVFVRRGGVFRYYVIRAFLSFSLFQDLDHFVAVRFSFPIENCSSIVVFVFRRKGIVGRVRDI